MTTGRGTRALAPVGWLLGLLGLLCLTAFPAQAADHASIDHAQLKKGELQLLVSVPGGRPVDLDTVKVSIDGHDAVAQAASAETTDEIQRTTVLAIDTSLSMKGERIAEARKAALAYLDAVPANVRVGIVSFAGDVTVDQPPSLNRAASREVIAHLELQRGTALYRAVRTAMTATGTDAGQRQVLLLSDGVDSTGTEVLPLVATIRASKVKIDVVSLQQSDTANKVLNGIARASHGEILNAKDPAALTRAFAHEAHVLARQVLVTATVPDHATGTDAAVSVTLTAGSNQFTGSAFLPIRSPAGTPDPQPTETTPVKAGGFAVPKPVMFGGVGLIVLAAATVLGAALLVPGSDKPGVTEQIGAYGATSGRGARTTSPEVHQSLATHAKQAAEKALSNHRPLEARIALRLEGAGLAMKSAEWVLVHVGITIGVGLLGLLLGAGNVLVMLLALVFGALAPWLYLKIHQSRRLAAFNAGLADTLQLMSGSLSAGLSLAQSMDTIVREGTDPIASEFKRVIAENRLGVELEDALEGVAGRMQSKDFGWVVMAIRIQREVGGNLAELLLSIAATLREREYLRRHVKALSAEGRLSCWILGGLPPAFMAYLALSRPDYVRPMLTTSIGILMMIGMAVLLLVGVFWMSKLAKVDL